LGQRFPVDAHWSNRLVRAEVELEEGTITFHRLRRREPADQPVLRVATHQVPGTLAEE
jgi:hypothetical protein